MPALIEGKQPVIFCDYDGTITEEDVIQMVMREFAPPEWKTIVKQILDERTLSIDEGLKQLFALISSDQKEKIIAFVRDEVRLRAGFLELLDFCMAQSIPFLVVSGGVDFLITPILNDHCDKLKLFTNVADFSGSYIAVQTPWAPEDCDPCNQCACCKIRIMQDYPAARFFRITIGDSLTDLGMTEKADLAFARARLLDYASEKNLSVTSFNDFNTIQDNLRQRLNSSHQTHEAAL